jgi:CubicO group peptidase (beta-lactamase class C family)
MMIGQDRRRLVTRRGVLVGAVAAGVASTATLPRPSAATEWADDDPLLAALDQKIVEGMERYSIPGVAVGVIWRGQSYMRGYGVTDVSNPQPVNTDTLFKTASIAKTFTGTAAMRLVDQRRLVLDQRVDSYVTDFVAPAGAQSVTVRQLLNHTAGWLGEDFHDTGSDDGALARYVHDIRNLPQLTPVGELWDYNNAAVCCAGRVIEVVTGLTYEAAVEQLVSRPLGMSRSGFAATPDDFDNLALPHDVGSDGKAVVNPAVFQWPRNGNPAGGQWVSSVKDLLAFAQFHLGDGRAADGQRVMSLAALRGMWSTPGPGGTLDVELIGAGVSWQLRPTAEGVVVVNHGGDVPGYHPYLMLVPAKQFAIVFLNNGELGTWLKSELFTRDWVLRHFVGLHNLPAPPRRLSASELAQYEGRYVVETIGNPPTFDNQGEFTRFRLTGRPDGTLERRYLSSGEAEAEAEDDLGPGAATDIPPSTLTFYADDYVIDQSTGARYNFLRDGSGAVVWLRYNARLRRRGG